LEKGKFSANILHGAARSIRGEIIGVEAHGARPEQGINAIEVASALIDGMKTITVSPTESASIKMTQLEAGGKSTNIIPGNATFSVDVRAQKNKVMDQLLEEFERIIQSVETLYDAKIHREISSGIVAAERNEQAEKIMYDAIVEHVGKDHAIKELIT